jgi:hypothetical protein
MKNNHFFKREDVAIDIRANEELIKLGYAQPGDNVRLLQMVTFSNFNEKLTFQAPSNVSPLPGK